MARVIPVGDAFLVNTIGSGAPFSGSEPTIATLSETRFVVSWSGRTTASHDVGSRMTDVLAQVFDTSVKSRPKLTPFRVEC